MILAPAIMTAEKDPKVAASKCLESVGLDPESYRIGHTKARLFSAGYPYPPKIVFHLRTPLKNLLDPLNDHLCT